MTTRCPCPTCKRATAHLIPCDTPPQPLFSLAPRMEGVQLRLKQLSFLRSVTGPRLRLGRIKPHDLQSVHRPQYGEITGGGECTAPANATSQTPPGAAVLHFQGNTIRPTRAPQRKQQLQRGSRERLRGQTAGGCVVPRVRGLVSTSLRVAIQTCDTKPAKSPLLQPPNRPPPTHFSSHHPSTRHECYSIGFFGVSMWYEWLMMCVCVFVFETWPMPITSARLFLVLQSSHKC